MLTPVWCVCDVWYVIRVRGIGDGAYVRAESNTQ